MICKRVKIQVDGGLHLRPAKALCNKALQYECGILLIKENRTANAKSFLSVLACQVKQGDVVEFQFHGVDEEKAAFELEKFITEGLQE